MTRRTYALPAALAAALAASLLAAACARAPAPAPDAADIDAARAAAQELQSRLSAELRRAMASGGPVAAIEVCRVAAPAIAADLSSGGRVEIGRTALRVRNRANTPDAWERAGLQAFLARHADGEPLAGMEIAEVVSEDGAEVTRWMSAIPLGGVCATCHGTAVADDARAAILAAYPDDEAVGFAVGDLRGAFTARITNSE